MSPVVRLALAVLPIAVSLVPLIACGNVAGTLSMIGRTPESELALRHALVASRGRAGKRSWASCIDPIVTLKAP